jgi:HAE1 family hydrophobic/amphiphilic exporter-1
VAIALILAAVFIPVAFMGGITGRLYQQFALTIAISVLISAFNALTLSPALSALLLRPRKTPTGPLGKLGAGFNRGFGRATDGYVGINRRSIRKIAIPLVLLAGVAGRTVIVGRQAPVGVRARRGPGVRDHRRPAPRRRVAPAHEGGLREGRRHPGQAARDPLYNGIAGYSFFTRTAASYSGTGFVGLAPWDERKGAELSSTAIVASLNAQFSQIPEARVFAVSPPAIPASARRAASA